MITIYHNQTCSKSLCALTVLEESGLPFTVVNYLETPPSADELNLLLQQLNMEPENLVRKNEPIFATHFEGKKLSRSEWIDAMVTFPILIERPIIVTDKGAVIARPIEKLNDLLANN